MSSKYFHFHSGDKADKMHAKDGDKPIFKHSMYMQSRDSTWLSRNAKKINPAEDPSPQEDSND